MEIKQNVHRNSSLKMSISDSFKSLCLIHQVKWLITHTDFGGGGGGGGG